MSKPKKYAFQTPLKVAWGDMDIQGHVNNVAFARYFETARAEFYERLKRDTGYERPHDVMSVMNRLEMDYRRQVKFPAALEITVGLIEVTSRTYWMGGSMWSEEGECVATGVSHHIWIDPTSGRPVRMPESFRKIAEALREEA